MDLIEKLNEFDRPDEALQQMVHDMMRRELATLAARRYLADMDEKTKEALIRKLLDGVDFRPEATWDAILDLIPETGIQWMVLVDKMVSAFRIPKTHAGLKINEAVTGGHLLRRKDGTRNMLFLPEMSQDWSYLIGRDGIKLADLAVVIMDRDKCSRRTAYNRITDATEAKLLTVTGKAKNKVVKISEPVKAMPPPLPPPPVPTPRPVAPTAPVEPRKKTLQELLEAAASEA